MCITQNPSRCEAKARRGGARETGERPEAAAAAAAGHPAGPAGTGRVAAGLPRREPMLRAG
eukprot:7029546-Pyramimonas_sp.AAC.1